MYKVHISTKIGGKSQHYFRFIGSMEKDFPFYNWKVKPKLELVALDVILLVFLSEQKRKKALIYTQET